jgi:hypothetical protein
VSRKSSLSQCYPPGLGSFGLLYQTGISAVFFRKEVIQPQVLLRLPCYDFTPIMSHTLSACLLAVSLAISSTAHFRDVTGGVYKARERIHGAVLMRHY